MRTSSKAEKQQKKFKNNRKFIGNVKIVIQGTLKTENIMKGRNFCDQSCPVVIIIDRIWWQLNNRSEKLRVHNLKIQR